MVKCGSAEKRHGYFFAIKYKHRSNKKVLKHVLHSRTQNKTFQARTITYPHIIVKTATNITSYEILYI